MATEPSIAKLQQRLMRALVTAWAVGLVAVVWIASNVIRLEQGIAMALLNTGWVFAPFLWTSRLRIVISGLGCVALIAFGLGFLRTNLRHTPQSPVGTGIGIAILALACLLALWNFVRFARHPEWVAECRPGRRAVEPIRW